MRRKEELNLPISQGGNGLVQPRAERSPEGKLERKGKKGYLSRSKMSSLGTGKRGKSRSKKGDHRGGQYVSQNLSVTKGTLPRGEDRKEEGLICRSHPSKRDRDPNPS